LALFLNRSPLHGKRTASGLLSRGCEATSQAVFLTALRKDAGIIFPYRGAVDCVVGVGWLKDVFYAYKFGKGICYVSIYHTI